MFRNFRCFLLLSFLCSPQKKEMNENISFHVTSLAKLIQLLSLVFVYDIISILYIRYLCDLVTFCALGGLECKLIKGRKYNTTGLLVLANGITI